ncbi:MAG: cytidine deaminase [Bacteroidaceae bacterium]|nr:cytidine deaminase [Bacteroidaceae bacterium]
MKERKIEIPVKVYTYDELNEGDRQLIDRAKEMTYHSYAPYSRFSVGAAALLANGETVCGSNQENAAYPSGLCAERTTLFYANSRYPDVAVKALAIAARNESGKFVQSPCSPCGACRQVMLESQARGGEPMRILLYGTSGIYELSCVEDLLPLCFTAADMEV